jgi:hypothetical protein
MRRAEQLWRQEVAAEDETEVENHGKVFGRSDHKRQVDDTYSENTDESLSIS